MQSAPSTLSRCNLEFGDTVMTAVEKRPEADQASPQAIRHVAFDSEFSGPLKGLRVIDLSRVLAGNMISLQLADYGADVIKVESPGTGDPLRAWLVEGHSLSWKVYGRNKKSLTLDLRTDAAREVLLELVATADVFLENYRPGTLEKMGLGPDVLMERNPDLIVVRVSGFGQTGPYRERPGFGTLVEAMSGFAYRNGFADREPVLPPIHMADMVTGLYGAMATLIAVRSREHGVCRGQIIDLSLLEPIFSILGPEAAWHRVTGKVRERVGSRSNTAAPRNVYRTRDGKWLAMSGSTQPLAARIFAAIGRADMIDDPRFATNEARLNHRDEIDEVIGGWIAARDRNECLAVFREAGATVAPVNDIGDIMRDAHFIEREILIETPDDDLGSLPVHNIVPRLSETPGGFTRPAPGLGEHNVEILESLGYTPEDVEALAEDGCL